MAMHSAVETFKGSWVLRDGFKVEKKVVWLGTFFKIHFLSGCIFPHWQGEVIK